VCKFPILLRTAVANPVLQADTAPGAPAARNRWEDYMVAVADGSKSREQLTGKITELMGGDPVPIE
jgi:hypothetical protein